MVLHQRTARNEANIGHGGGTDVRRDEPQVLLPPEDAASAFDIMRTVSIASAGSTLSSRSRGSGTAPVTISDPSSNRLDALAKRNNSIGS